MSRMKCTELSMEGSYFVLTANAYFGYPSYSIRLGLNDLKDLSLDELRAALDEIEDEVFAMKSACGSAISAVAAMEDDWRESDDTPENGDGGGQDA